MKPRLVLSCEHGGNRIPARYRQAFEGAAEALASHRGWDRGALTIARRLADRLGAPLVSSRTSRLLVDLNRSLGHRALFSEWSRALPREERERIVRDQWQPFRAEVEAAVRGAARGSVLHVSVHSFTPILDGRAREVDVGLLYDPQRAGERAFAKTWLRALAARRADLRLRRNQPYRGNADGHTTALRRRFPPGRYLGLELEVSQRFPLGPSAAWRALQEDLVQSLAAALGTDARSGAGPSRRTS